MTITLKQGATKEHIEYVLNTISELVKEKGVDTRKYCGVIEIKEDPLKIQKRLRDEW